MSTLESLALTYMTAIRRQSALANTTDELSYRDFLGAFLLLQQIIANLGLYVLNAVEVTLGDQRNQRRLRLLQAPTHRFQHPFETR